MITEAGADWYRALANNRIGGPLSRQLGLPRPAQLRRYRPGQPLTEGPVLVGNAGTGSLADHVLSLPGMEQVSEATDRLGALVLDATGLGTLEELAVARDFLGSGLRRLGPSGRVLVLANPPEQADGVTAAAARQALDGLVRSMAKELRDGATANLVFVAPDATAADTDSTVLFLLSARSAYLDGQVVRVGPSVGTAVANGSAGPPHTGRVVVVTGAARGIGAAIAEVFARDGAIVVCLDVPAQGDALAATSNRIGGLALQLDITAPDAPARLLEYLSGRHGGVDVVVHNAGITRDKLLVNMDAERWDSVLAVNLRAQLDLNSALLAPGSPLRSGGRLVSVSSTSGIAGNRGQTNYAASKAGIIGMVRALAPSAAGRGVTVNAVAPGFIETAMTAAMPFGTREAGRRINSLHQGGLPVDVAETIAWLAEPGSGGVTGQVVRVCGQSMVGA
ncbi:MAG TPA: 3-oxoacyl-ACP reductase [Pseudonocardia sp.]|uniref:3-oxoacyl-ACP reductase n=1 Tax=Pseudonocardia sp. TaxID=60912 RepID=UPI002CD8F929|nr:3-oxoacyl-ACP reductase [Pseudonocardia sp.]HTF47717.1 3-oxoacyl-ACP reductase [Pseudonocardia sp.]